MAFHFWRFQTPIAPYWETQSWPGVDNHNGILALATTSPPLSSCRSPASSWSPGRGWWWSCTAASPSRPAPLAFISSWLFSINKTFTAVLWRALAPKGNLLEEGLRLLYPGGEGDWLASWWSWRARKGGLRRSPPEAWFGNMKGWREHQRIMALWEPWSTEYIWLREEVSEHPLHTRGMGTGLMKTSSRMKPTKNKSSWADPSLASKLAGFKVLHLVNHMNFNKVVVGVLGEGGGGLAQQHLQAGQPH